MSHSANGDAPPTFRLWLDGGGADRPVYDGRSRADKLLHLRRAAEQAALRLLGAEPWVQILIIDLSTHAALPFLPDPITRPTHGAARGKKGNPEHDRKRVRQRFAVAAHNAVLATNAFRHAVTLLEVAGVDPVRDLPAEDGRH